MTTQQDLRKHLCSKCDHNGWITRDIFGDRLTEVTTAMLTNHDETESEVTTVYSVVKMCGCLRKIREGYYSV